jgi:putative FmdB family regulatory protein
MPLYEYQCDACGHRFEAIRKFSDEPLEICPKCGGHIQKLISAPAFAFKGTGWYVTDYAKKDSVAPGKSDGPGSRDKESSESSESKDSKESKASGEKDSKNSGDTSTKESSSTPAKTETSTKSESSSTPDKSA